MRSFFFIAALLVPAVALADITTLTVNDGSTASFSGNDCGNSLRVNWTVQITYGQICSDFKVWATESSSGCGNSPTGNDLEIASVSAGTIVAQPSGSATIKNTELPGQAGADAGFACGTQVQKTWKICASHTVPVSNGFTGFTCSSSSTADTQNVTVTYDGQPPAAPEITTVAPLNSGLRVTSTLPDDAISVRIGRRVLGSGEDFVFTNDVGSTSDVVTLDVTGLQNEVTYEVVGEALDQAGNVSALSAPSQGTPTMTFGFWDTYKSSGGGDTGGCTVGANGESSLPLWALFGVVAAAITLVSRRMRS